MKISLPVKLGIFVVLLFAAVTATCLLWTPVKIRYYVGKLRSDDPKERVAGVDGLLGMGEKGVNALALELGGGIKAAELIKKNWEVDNTILDAHNLPLHTAAEKGYFGAACLLIDKGVDINSCVIWGHGSGTKGIKWEYGDTPLDVARYKKMKSLLRAHGAKTAEELENESSVKSQGSSVKEEKK